MKKLLFCLVFFLISSAEARVFDINKDSLAPYFLVTGGSSAIGKSAFENEANNVNTSGDVRYNYSGEFGLLYSRQLASLRFGIEFLKPMKADNISGTNSGGTVLYTETSDILGYVPKATLEINLHGTNTFRSFVSFTGGLASVTVKNTYTFTTAGTSAYPGTDSAIEAKGTGTLMAASLGYEGILTDTTTYAFEFGYRSLKINNLAYSKGYMTMNGAVGSGDSFMNGSNKRILDLSGGFVSLGFRFYL